MNINNPDKNEYLKYLKYKSKYLELKKNLQYHLLINLKTNMTNKSTELTILEDKDQEQVNLENKSNLKGGGYFYEQNDIIKRINMLENKKFKKELYQFTSIYLKANLTNPNIIKKYSKIRKTMLKNNSLPAHLYHLTLLIFEINLDYPIITNSISYLDKPSSNKYEKRRIRKDLSFLDQDEIKTTFESIFKNMVLTTESYEILGKLVRVRIEGGQEIGVGVKNPESNDCVKYPGSYFVDKFEVNNKNLITAFRTKFYEKLNEFMKLEFIKAGGKSKDYVGYRADNDLDPDYILIFYDNFSKDIPLLAIKKFYYGKNNWNPHISIFNMEELGLDNMGWLEKYIMDFLTSQDRTHSDQMVWNELKKNSTVKELLKKNARPKITIRDIDFELQV